MDLKSPSPITGFVINALPVAATVCMAVCVGSLIPLPLLSSPLAWIPLSTLGVGAGFAYLATRRLGPVCTNQVIPGHLLTALDGLTEGVLALDRKGRIALVNQAFLEISGHLREQLLGRRALDLGWSWREEDGDDASNQDVPWLETLRDGRVRQGQFLGLHRDSRRTFVVSVAPILDEQRHSLGALVSLEDVTKLRKKQAELAALLETLRQSAAQIRKQNLELEQLATRDSLTGCHSRRTGFEFLERFCLEARRHQTPLACAMVDIDDFRSINDRYGHVLADEVLRKMAVCLQNSAREHDVVCRYGGEEFLVLMPQTALDEAAALADQLRRAVQRLAFHEFKVAVSVGVSAFNRTSGSPQQMLDEANQCLAQAKSLGRNQVVRVDQLQAPPEEASAASPEVGHEQSSMIPFPAVTALISALAYRDAETASHSRRVADLCAAVGQRLMSLSNCYVLETAALLHDIGKIGVPDSVLLKPTALEDQEWELMKAHEQIGVEIIRASFASQELSEIVENYRRRFEDSNRDRPIPLGARILAVADAYDAMVTDHHYRHGVSSAEAVAELRRCAGTQFDPEIVDQFLEILPARGRETCWRVEVGREAALALGMELERLAEAVDQQHLETLKALAGRLSATAAKTGAPEIAAKALELEAAAAAGSDLLGILRCANELLSYCRATQATYVDRGAPARRTPEPAADQRCCMQRSPFDKVEVDPQHCLSR